jgi:hypothetical protein
LTPKILTHLRGSFLPATDDPPPGRGAVMGRMGGGLEIRASVSNTSFFTGKSGFLRKVMAYRPCCGVVTFTFI